MDKIEADIATKLADPDYPQVFKEYEPKIMRDSYLEVVSREKWGAAPASKRDFMCTPAEAVLLLDTGGVTCDSAETCQAALQAVQKHYMEEKGLSDIPWNFMVGGDGRAYEGRGWSGKSTKLIPKYENLDGTSIDIAYIGDYSDKIPDLAMTRAAYNLIDLGQGKQAITANYQFESGLMANFVEVEKPHSWPKTVVTYSNTD